MISMTFTGPLFCKKLSFFTITTAPKPTRRFRRIQVCPKDLSIRLVAG